MRHFLIEGDWTHINLELGKGNHLLIKTCHKNYLGFQIHCYIASTLKYKRYNMKDPGLAVSWSLVKKMGESLGLVKLRLARKLHPLVVSQFGKTISVRVHKSFPAILVICQFSSSFLLSHADLTIFSSTIHEILLGFVFWVKFLSN